MKKRSNDASTFPAPYLMENGGKVIAYKLMRQRKDGSLGTLFINRKARYLVGQWLMARAYPTKGFAFRPGWHALLVPHAPHLSTKGRIWVKVEVRDYHLFERPRSQGGRWVLAQKMRIIEILGEE